MELASINPALIARPNITVVSKDNPCRSWASRSVAVVETATSRMPPPAAVALTSRSAITRSKLKAM